jgi:hypothetical protein
LVQCTGKWSTISHYAEARDIRRAYRRLALQMHLDRGGDPDRFHALQAAYETALEYSLVTLGEQPS